MVAGSRMTSNALAARTHFLAGAVPAQGSLILPAPGRAHKAVQRLGAKNTGNREVGTYGFAMCAHLPWLSAASPTGAYFVPSRVWIVLPLRRTRLTWTVTAKPLRSGSFSSSCGMTRFITSSRIWPSRCRVASP